MGGGGKGGGGSKEYTVGYRYFIGMHMVFCQTPDKLLKIRVGDRELVNATITGSQRGFSVNKPKLFGGEDHEGGIVGNIDIDFGEDSQTVNPYLQSKLPGNIVPAFRGVLGLVLNQTYVSAKNPYFKKWDVQVQRMPAKGWYDTKAQIGNQANPIHILYEVITENSIGEIDDASFRAAADTLYNENFGLSFLWKGGSIRRFMDEIINHIGGVLYVRPTTGKFYVKLVRDDYTISNLPVLDETNIISLESYQRRTLSDTINQITVKYIEEDTGKEASVSVQDLANIQAQGQIVEDVRNYVGIANHDLATRVAQRDIGAGSALLGKVTLKVNRDAYNLMPGDVFVLNWDILGITQMVCRVVEINYGTLDKNEITIKALEDVYALPSAVYTEVQAPYWEDPILDPTPCPVEEIYEAPYWDVKRNMDEANFDYIPDDAGYIVTLGSRPNGAAFNYELQTDDGGGYSATGKYSFAPVCSLSAAISETDTSASISIVSDMNLAESGNDKYAWIGNEAVRIDSIDLTAGTLTIGRGVLDTVPAAHSSGEMVVFAGAKWYGMDSTEYTAGQSIDAKLLPVTGKGTLDLSAAAILTKVLNSRLDRPYPPAHLQVNGVLYPDLAVGDMALDWYHRDKTQQDGSLVDDTMADVGPETGTTYSIEIRRLDTDGVLYSNTGISANNFSINYSEINYEGDIIVEVWSVLNAYDSWQKQKRGFLFLRQKPYATETDEIITTEAGEYLLMEG